MLIAYIPREKIVVQADLYNTAAAVPNASNRTFQQNLQRLKLDVSTIVGIHGNPAPMAQFQGFVNKTQ
jgi:predicted aldo/keto reductase-like oxidoreductase